MVGYLNWGIASLAHYFTTLEASLPASPLHMDATRHDQILAVMGWATYFVPVHEEIVVLEALISAILIWYGVRILLAWLKAAGE